MSSLCDGSPGFIYKIKCAGNNKFYIGSTTNIENRWKRHLRDLRAGKHHSQHMQRAYKIFGEDSFIFSVVEIVDDVIFLCAREQFWIWRTQCHIRSIGFNMSQDAVAGMRGRTHSVQTRRKMSESQRLSQSTRDRGPMPQAQREKISAALRGRKLSAQHKANISKGSKGRLVTDEARANNSASQKGRKFTAEHRRKLSIARRKRKNTPAMLEALATYRNSRKPS